MDALVSTLLDVAIHVSRFTKKKDTHGEETAWRYRRVLVFEAGGSSGVSLSLFRCISRGPRSTATFTPFEQRAGIPSH